MADPELAILERFLHEINAMNDLALAWKKMGPNIAVYNTVDDTTVVRAPLSGIVNELARALPRWVYDNPWKADRTQQ